MDIDFNSIKSECVESVVERWIKDKGNFDQEEMDLHLAGISSLRELLQEAFMFGLCSAFQIATNELEYCQTVIDAQSKLDVMYVETAIIAKKTKKQRVEKRSEIDFDVTKP